MAESPVRLQAADCGNGKRKMVVREREYDLFSWPGLKTFMSVIIAIVGTTVAVLTAYYTAEGSQNDRIARHEQVAATVQQRIEHSDKGLTQMFQRLDAALCEQRTILDVTRQAVTRIDTHQQLLVKEVEKLSDKLDKRP